MVITFHRFDALHNSVELNRENKSYHSIFISQLTIKHISLLSLENVSFLTDHVHFGQTVLICGQQNKYKKAI